jgi:small subunit ribosomal protein S8
MVDLLNDALITIKNASYIGKQECKIKASKLIANVLKVMQQNGYILKFEYLDDKRGGKFKVKLSATINNCGVIKPRFAVKKTDFEKFETRYLPGQDFGLLIITTTRGVLSHNEAKKLGIGGRLLAYIY